MSRFMIEAQSGIVKMTHYSNNKYSMIKLFIKYSFSEKFSSLCFVDNETGEVLALHNEYEKLWFSSEIKEEIINIGIIECLLDQG